MNKELLDIIRQISPEEEMILSGNKQIEKNIYMSDEKNKIDASKLLEAGKLIQVRPHTRFVHFPEHTHNYIEVIYMCSGTTRHLINGKELILKEGELLFLNQNATQEIFPAKENDIAVNFIILPEFFDYGLKMMETEQNRLRSFIINCLTGDNVTSAYLHFKVSEVLPIQNLVENLIWTIVNKKSNKRSIQQATMGLLFLEMMNYMDLMETEDNNDSQKLVINVLKYIEEHYRDGELTELAGQLHYDVYWLSKEIRKRTGSTYTELLQKKRLNQAAYLLTTTTISVMDVAMAVGYDNISYFHRIFQKEYNMTPRKYRLEQKIG